MVYSHRNKLVLRMEKILQDFASIFNSVWTFIAFAFIALVNFFAPAQFNLMLVGGLVVTDIITALFALWMVCKRDSTTWLETFKKFYEQWTSRRASDSIPKLIYYFLLILLAFAMGHVVGESDQYMKLATGIICYVEIRSIIENGDKAFNLSMWELVLDYAKKLLPKK